MNAYSCIFSILFQIQGGTHFHFFWALFYKIQVHYRLASWIMSMRQKTDHCSSWPFTLAYFTYDWYSLHSACMLHHPLEAKLPDECMSTPCLCMHPRCTVRQLKAGLPHTLFCCMSRLSSFHVNYRVHGWIYDGPAGNDLQSVVSWHVGCLLK